MRARATLAALMTLALAGAIGSLQTASASAPAPAQPNPADVATTRTYLQALDTYVKAMAANVPASKASSESAIAAIEHECPGTLSGVPEHRFVSAGESPGPLLGRAKGEENRIQRQLGKLTDEMDDAAVIAVNQPDRQALTGFSESITSLSWSNPKIAQLARAGVNAYLQLTELSPPAVCADIRAWAASGYKTLSVTTKQFLSTMKSLERGPSLMGVATSTLLRPYEGAAGKLVLRNILRLEITTLRTLSGTLESWTALPQKLGLPTDQPEETEEQATEPLVTVGHGRTAVGERFTVRVGFVQVSRAGQTVPPPRGRLCDIRLESTRNSAHHRQGGVVSRIDSEIGCKNTGAHAEQSVDCNEGQLGIHANTLPRTRTVILRLSDGRTIRSHPVLLPKGRGGPEGLYYQVVRGPTPIPVSLTEFDAHGHRLRSEPLHHIHECTKHTFHNLPGGRRTLVRGEVSAQGPAFSIVSERYRFLGHTNFETKLDIKPLTARGSEEESGLDQGGGVIFVGAKGHGNRPDPFSRHEQTGCLPHPYAIVYGVLKPPGASVWALVNGRQQELRMVRIPASMHAGGVLAYAALPALPEKLFVRSNRGKTIFTEDLGSAGKEAVETCEGEAEG